MTRLDKCDIIICRKFNALCSATLGFQGGGMRESGENPEHLTVAVNTGELFSRRKPAIGNMLRR